MKDKNQIVRSLDKSFNQFSSWKEIFDRINYYFKTKFYNFIKTKTCNHNYKYIREFKYTITDLEFTYKSGSYECSSCGHRKCTGDFSNLSKKQRDYLDMWMKYEVES